MNKYLITTYSPDGYRLQEVVDTEPSLKTLQSKVGGYIELVPFAVKETYVNEEGRFLGYEPNYIGSNAAGSRIILVGNVVTVEKLK